MRRFRAEGRMPVPDPAWRAATQVFRGFALDDAGTLAEIARLHRESGYLADPHTAIGTAAAMAVPPADPAIPVVVAATAHPAKFPDAVRRATGLTPPLPPRMADLYQRPERLTRMPAALDAVESFVRAHARRNAARIR
jgi:threonine synthase